MGDMNVQKLRPFRIPSARRGGYQALEVVMTTGIMVPLFVAALYIVIRGLKLFYHMAASLAAWPFL